MAQKPIKEDRFVKTVVDGGGMSDNYMAIYVDKQTGVNYLYVSGGYGGGLTPLLNRDGTPVITSVPRDEK